MQYVLWYYDPLFGSVLTLISLKLGYFTYCLLQPFFCRMLLDLHAAQAGNEDVKALKQMAPKENIAAIHNFVRCSFSDMEVSSSAYHGIFIWKLKSTNYEKS